MPRIDPSWFVARYDEDPDPWDFATSDYEADKYAATVGVLGDRRYRSAFEAGCAIGVLTTLLAARCEALLAVDAVPAAVAQARERTRDLPHVRIERATLPEGWPAGPFDLVVISEIAYYFDDAGLDDLLDAATRSLEPGGDLVACHWTGETDYPLTAEAVHDRMAAHPALDLRERTAAPGYELAVLRRTSP
ncbi:SAM-dependent methyltransferase [Euzebya sp.]|uniref:SAM-dependent methyltransferase n=1 Tax=Euzebya sp. TaxID=1971409 RepID=UPI003519721D